MNDMQMSVRSVECYLLVTAMSPVLQQYIADSAAISKQGTSESGAVVAFSVFSDQELVQEMESLGESAPEFVVKKPLRQKSMVAYSLEREVMNAINEAQESGRAAEIECKRRLAKGQKALKSLFLYDYIGSLDHEGSTAQTRRNPSFRVSIADLKSEQVTATIKMTSPNEAPESFTLSARTVMFLKKIMKPQQNAGTVTIDYSGDDCTMQIGMSSSKVHTLKKSKRAAV